jgi:hypothetical protein
LDHFGASIKAWIVSLSSVPVGHLVLEASRVQETLVAINEDRQQARPFTIWASFFKRFLKLQLNSSSSGNAAGAFDLQAQTENSRLSQRRVFPWALFKRPSG